MVVRSTRCNKTYRIQSKVEHSPEWKIIASIKHKGEDRVMYQGVSCGIDPDSRTPQLLEYINK